MVKRKVSAYPRLKLFNPLLAQTAAAFGVLTLPPLSTFIVKELELSAFMMGLMMSSFYLGCIVFSFFTGQIINFLGIHKSIFISLLVIGSFIMAGSFFDSVWAMLLLLALSGMGYSLINPAINLLITQDFSVEVRGFAMSVKQMGVTLGGVFTALLLPKLAFIFDWRTSLFIGGAMVACFSLYFYCMLKSYASPPAPNSNPNHLKNIKIFFQNSKLVRLSILSFFFVGAQFSYFMYLVLFLNLDLNYSIAASSFLLALSQASGAIGRVIWGAASDRSGDKRKVLSLIGILSSIFLVLLSLSPFFSMPYLLMAAITIILGFTISGWNGIFQAAIIEYGGEKTAAVSSGVSLTFTYLGIFLFPLFFGWTKDLFSSFSLSWVILSICLILSTILIYKDQRSTSVKTKKFAG
ncbi:MFS transporter [Cytobacillus oceanisediminis]|uniref:Sugar phosphate permease n=1 Tax=Cytobacillus oceanisediminis TaxID=665099 RepID=A0A562JRQ6_9BACI|nr:MFS transporter [Cytobacillus oceanisediminis]TWH85849.1 sugar phosphate permease [Cytobacillus oceanisediminis]